MQTSAVRNIRLLSASSSGGIVISKTTMKRPGRGSCNHFVTSGIIWTLSLQVSLTSGGRSVMGILIFTKRSRRSEQYFKLPSQCIIKNKRCSMHALYFMIPHPGKSSAIDRCNTSTSSHPSDIVLWCKRWQQFEVFLPSGNCLNEKHMLLVKPCLISYPSPWMFRSLEV